MRILIAVILKNKQLKHCFTEEIVKLWYIIQMKHVASKMYDNLAKGRECCCSKVNQAMIQK